MICHLLVDFDILAEAADDAPAQLREINSSADQMTRDVARMCVAEHNRWTAADVLAIPSVQEAGKSLFNGFSNVLQEVDRSAMLVQEEFQFRQGVKLLFDDGDGGDVGK